VRPPDTRDGDAGLYVLILAGGSGTRLWPYSRRSRPKQLLALTGESSMLALAVARLAPLAPPDRVYILTGAEHAADVRVRFPDLPADHVVAEPAALGTAAAVGLGMALIRARDPEATMCVVTADHLIAPEDVFRAAVLDAARVAATGRLVTFGIRPTAPDTRYGYVELGRRLADDQLAVEAYEVARFVEKPDRAAAERYLAGGRHVWNSGMFAWTVPVLAAEFARHLPALAARLDEITAAAGIAGAGDPGFATRLAEIWGRVTDRTTIDYGIMEKSDHVACLPAAFDWSDIGSWDALKDALPADEAGNAVVGDASAHLGIDTTNSLIVARGGRLVATIGVDGLVIVDTGDAVLICPLDRAEEVKAVVAALEARGDAGRL